MPTKRANYQVASFKAAGDKGQVEAIVSVFGNVDKGGDRVVKGAFAESIADWQKSGDPVPVIVSHGWGDLFDHIGVVNAMEETDRGLKVNYTLDIADNPTAAQAFRLLKRGSLKEHSFAFEIMPGGERRAEDGANELTKLSIIEVGPTLKGMNPATEVLSVKSALSVGESGVETFVPDGAGQIVVHGRRDEDVLKALKKADARKEIEDAIAAIEAAQSAAFAHLRALLDPKNDEPPPEEGAADTKSPDADEEPLATSDTEHPEEHDDGDQKLLAVSIDDALLDLERIKAVRI